MDADDLKATLGAGCLIEHALEYGSTIVGGRRTGFNEFLRHHPALRLAIAAGQIPLEGNRDITGSLTTGTNAQIERDPFRRILSSCGAERKAMAISTPVNGMLDAPWKM
jgi:hypothetical protein